MITLNNLSKSHGARSLFRDASIQFNPGRRYGVVGANGSGKSTILRILAGEEEASGGSVSMPKKMRIGVLEQDHFRYEQERILDVVMMGNKVLWDAMVEKDRLLAHAHESFDADRYAELEDIVLAYDGYSLEAVAGEILEGLNIETAVHDQPLSTLSGGFKLRVLLAKTLASNPDLLLLDEPTNHLDNAARKWLEDYLQDYPGAVFLISHDPKFLNKVVEKIIELEDGELHSHTGNFSYYLRVKEERRIAQQAAYDRQQRELERQQEFIERFGAKNTKATQVKSREKQLEKIEKIEAPK
ncbi:MAG: ABC-F family ATP-binding cassette domain-containing protein, partial [Bradymonadaceae bacterium]|nr:ABC-F family ATP-binding cassette domain-containing protein [Lujinxingiaceae bacterium]